MLAVLVMTLASIVAVAGQAPADVEDAVDEGSERSTAEEGKLLYGIYCTSCHGPAGKGDGPTAKSLTPRPADLTRLSRDNDGEFPTARVIMSIDGRNPVPGHRKSQMPLWGLSLQEPSSDTNQEQQVREKILRLVDYLKTIQDRVD
jgi:mono/diheme cytochrome c family protein